MQNATGFRNTPTFLRVYNRSQPGGQRRNAQHSVGGAARVDEGECLGDRFYPPSDRARFLCLRALSDQLLYLD